MEERTDFPYFQIRRSDRSYRSTQSCFCDQFIADTQPYGPCYYLSLFGREEDVKAVSAHFIEKARLQVVNDFHRFEIGIGTGKRKFKMLTRKTGNVLHRIMYDQDVFGTDKQLQVIMGYNCHEVCRNLIKAIDWACSTPVVERWGHDLLNWLENEGNVQSLTVRGIDGLYACEVSIPDEAKLDEYVTSVMVPREWNRAA